VDGIISQIQEVAQLLTAVTLLIGAVTGLVLACKSLHRHLVSARRSKRHPPEPKA
jgi:hypothetical protein